MNMTAGRPSPSSLADQRLFTRLALALAAFVVSAVAQWALRGFTAPLKTPIWIDIHGIVMPSWLALIITQNMLAEPGNLALHRRLGWSSLVLVSALVVLGVISGRMRLPCTACRHFSPTRISGHSPRSRRWPLAAWLQSPSRCADKCNSMAASCSVPPSS